MKANLGSLKAHMRRMIVWVCAASVACIAAAARADYELVGTGADKSLFHIDRKYITRKGKIIKSWVMITHGGEESVSGTYPLVKYRSENSLFVYDCAEHTVGAVQNVFYSGVLGRGDIVHRKQISIDKVQMIDVIPNSMQEIVIDWVCSHAPLQN